MSTSAATTMRTIKPAVMASGLLRGAFGPAS
jgi:hypothetical protein